MLSNDAIAMNIYTSFCSMSPKELFEAWRNLTDTLGGDFSVVYNKKEFDELIERMPEEELANLLKNQQISTKTICIFQFMTVNCTAHRI